MRVCKIRIVKGIDASGERKSLGETRSRCLGPDYTDAVPRTEKLYEKNC